MFYKCYINIRYLPCRTGALIGTSSKSIDRDIILGNNVELTFCQHNIDASISSMSKYSLLVRVKNLDPPVWVFLHH